MILQKITPGFVIQKFDTETNTWLEQNFIASDQVDIEDELGNVVEYEYLPDNFWDYYLNFDMVQP